MPELSTLGAVLAQYVEPYAEAQPAVLSRTVADPPFVPAGSRYIVPSVATGVWVGHEHKIATKTTTGWSYLAVDVGTSAWVKDEKLEVIFNGIAWEGSVAGGGSRAALTTANKRMYARTTVADGDKACDVPLVATPVSATILVLINGVAVSELGDGTKAGAACYFSQDNGLTALALSDLQAGAVLYWNGTVAMYQLSADTDMIDFVYEA